MHKDIIEHIAYDKGIEEGLERGKRECHKVIAIKEDLAYEQGLGDGYTKSLDAIRLMQQQVPYDSPQWFVLQKAIDLISQKIKSNKNV